MRKRLVAENVGAMRCAGRKEEWGFRLFCGDGAPEYLYRFQSSPVAGQWNDYFESQRRFYNALAPDLRERCSIVLPAISSATASQTV